MYGCCAILHPDEHPLGVSQEDLPGGWRGQGEALLKQTGDQIQLDLVELFYGAVGLYEEAEGLQPLLHAARGQAGRQP